MGNCGFISFLLLCNTNTSPTIKVRKGFFSSFYITMVKIGKIACFLILTEWQFVLENCDQVTN